MLYGLCKGYTMNASIRWNIEHQASGVAWVALLSHTRGAISNRIRALLSKRLRTWSHLRRNIFYPDCIYACILIVLFTLGITLSFCFGCRRSVGRILWITMFFFLWNIVHSLQFRWLVCCGYKPVYRARGLKAVLATQELPALESVDISEYLGDEFNESAHFQKPTTMNEIERRERDRIPKKTRQSTAWSLNGYRTLVEYRNT